MSMLLKPLDVVVSVKAAVLDDSPWTIAQMADYLGIDNAQVFRAAKNAAIAHLLLVDKNAHKAPYRPNRAAILDLLLHGLKYMMVPARGQITRGLPTSYAAPAMGGQIVHGDNLVPVWPTPDGTVRGESFEPLHRCVAGAALRDPRFYSAMALTDAIRSGRARERAVAANLLPEVIGAHPN